MHFNTSWLSYGLPFLCVYGRQSDKFKTSEMLDQIYEIQRTTGERVSNVVLMGMGGPSDGYDVVRFIRMLSDEHGLNISQKKYRIDLVWLTS